MTRPLILGLDFMLKHQIDLKWSDRDKGLHTQGKNVLVKMIYICEKDPYILIHTILNLPPRALGVIMLNWT